MIGETNLYQLIANMVPILHADEYVFVTTQNIANIERGIALCEFHEPEGTTLILKKSQADALELPYDYIARWMTLTIHSALSAVGLTAVFSTELAKHNISCNVVAGYYHDHIFVDVKDADKAVGVLQSLAEKAKG